MNTLIEGIEKAIEVNTYVTSVIAAVTIPDICGKLQYPNSKRSYSDWFEANMPPVYKEHMTGGDAFAIRCSLLHAYDGKLDKHNAHETLDRLRFTLDGGHLMSTQELVVDGIQIPPTIVLSAKQYSVDIVEAYKKWATCDIGAPLHASLEEEATIEYLFSNSGDIGGVIGYG